MVNSEFDAQVLPDVLCVLNATAGNSVGDYSAQLSKAAHLLPAGPGADALMLLFHVSNMMLEPEVKDGPFKAVGEWATRRTMLPEDLTPAELLVVRHYTQAAGHPDFTARLSDVLWLRERDHAAAERAVDEYLLVASNWDSSISPNRRADRLMRGAQISLQLGESGPKLSQVKGAIEGFLKFAFTSTAISAVIPVVNFALTNKLFNADDLLSQIERGIGDLAKLEPLHLARRALEMQAGLFHRAGKADLQKTALLRAAETYLAEAADCIVQGDRHPLSRTLYFENAVRALKRIPRYRDNPVIVALIEKTRKELVELRSQVVDYMRPIRARGSDISELVNIAIHAVSSEDSRNSILALATLVQPTDFDAIKSGSKEAIEGAVFASLFSTEHLDASGRVVAREGDRKPSMGIDDPKLWAQMMRQADLHRQLVVQGQIAPALEWIVHHHYISELGLSWLVNDNPMVPSAREYSIKKGILAGFKGDFLSATAILIPQVEHLLRVRLKEKGIVTAGLDKDGIEDEPSLDRLIDMSLENGTIDEHIAFDLRALLVEKLGANLRNDHCHGLMADGGYFSHSAIYFWAMVLRWICWGWIREGYRPPIE